jgi:hypothetical protein
VGVVNSIPKLVLDYAARLVLSIGGSTVSGGFCRD